MRAIASLYVILQPLLVFAAHHDIDFLVEEWVVDFMRPTKSGVKKAAERVTPFHIPDDNRKVCVEEIQCCRFTEFCANAFSSSSLLAYHSYLSLIKL